MAVYPYIVQHLQLENNEGFRFAPQKQYGHYSVIWWKNIPLGHIYTKPNETINKELENEVLKVINPTIKFYSDTEIKNRDFAQGSFLPFLNNTMNKVASKFEEAISSRVDVSVVVCTRNRSHYLKNCLESLLQQKVLPTEIIVVDNAPVDDSTERVVSNYEGVRYHKELRAGLDIARNTGAKLATAPIVAYTDDDVLVHPLWVNNVFQSFKESNVVAMTGLVIAATLDTESQQIFESFWSFNRGYQDKIYDKAFFESALAGGPPVWEIGAGANMAFRKDIFDKVGFFDERLDVGAAGCNGDSEMWYRILLNGYNIHYSPRAVCYHEHRKELSSLRRQLFYYMRGFTAAALIQQDQYEKANYRRLLFKKLPKYYVRLFIRGLMGKDLRHKTLWSEVKGIISGFMFYKKNKNNPV